MRAFKSIVLIGIAGLSGLASAPAHAQTGPYVNTTTGAINSGTTCGAPLIRTINVPESFIIGDLNVGFIASHSWRTDIQVQLVSPNSTVEILDGPTNQNINNYNILLDDSAGNLVNTAPHNTADNVSATPYENTVRPDSALSGFVGENAQGTWTFRICDNFPSEDDGTFRRAELVFTEATNADLSLTKTVDDATPIIGQDITYTITVLNSGPLSASGVQARDLLPSGMTYVSDDSGGAYNSGSGVWAIPGNIAANGSASLQITANVNATGDYDNLAEVIASNQPDPDSTPNNAGASPGEDDTDTVTITIDNSADLSLTKSVNDPTPSVGNTITYTLVVTNSGPNAVTGVQVRDLLPSGVSYTSDNGGGAYNPTSGVWTIPGGIASGATSSLQISATVNGSGNYANLAEIIASDRTDPDSTPNNANTTPVEDDTDVASITPGGTAGTPPILSCSAGSDTHDWDANTWPSGSLAQTYSGGSQTLDFTISGDTGAFLGGSPETNTDTTGGLLPAQNALYMLTNHVARADFVDVDFDIGATGTGVSGLQFSIFDVDFFGGQFTDQITVIGYLNGSVVAPILTDGVSNTVSGFTATGSATADNGTADGTVVITFTQRVDRVEIRYGNGPSAPAAPGNQAIALHDITYCRVSADLSATKSVEMYDPTSTGVFALPGNEVIYTITATNTGAGPVDTDTIFLVDALPGEVEFYNGDFNDGGAGTDSIEFTQSGSGLTFNQASDLGFSTGAVPPSSFAACNYSPVAVYDPAITYVCFNPSGAMAAGSPDPSFTVRFRARIK